MDDVQEAMRSQMTAQPPIENAPLQSAHDEFALSGRVHMASCPALLYTGLMTTSSFGILSSTDIPTFRC